MALKTWAGICYHYPCLGRVRMQDLGRTRLFTMAKKIGLQEIFMRVGIGAVLVVALSACATSCSPEARMERAEKINVSAGRDRENTARYVYEKELARTPPMGWNSWNAFHGDVNEEKIQGIADAMVESGLRDAGYTYLVIDDGWMADKRDSEGKLVGDPNKFPSGMKALSDYVHSKGLKFGLYEDRGHSTCMKLPGSFGHINRWTWIRLPNGALITSN